MDCERYGQPCPLASGDELERQIAELGSELAELKSSYQSLRSQAREVNKHVFAKQRELNALTRKRDSDIRREREARDDQVLRIEIIFKSNYLDMFTKHGWLQDIECLHKADYKRYKAICHAKRSDIDNLCTYATYLGVLK